MKRAQFGTGFGLRAMLLFFAFAALAVCCSSTKQVAQEKAAPRASFEVRLASDVPRDGYIEVAHPGSGKPLYISKKIEISGGDIARAKAVTDNGRPSVEFELNDRGEEKMRAMTRDHVGEKVAMMLNGEVTAAPTIRAEIGRRGIIHGNFTLDEAKTIARGLQP